MDKKKKILKEVLEEVHLYVDKSELLVKDIIWAISWLGGIYAIKDASDKRALASAYLIFALSLLMEFGKKIKDKKYYISRVVYSIFCMSAASILLMAFISLVGAKLITKENHYDIMYCISAGIMIFMGIDFFIAWVTPEYIELKNIDKDIDNENCEEKNIFQKKLISGNLGNISEGEKNE